MNLYNNKTKLNDNQSLYDSFNNFIFSDDRNIFNKLIARYNIYTETKHLSGDIVECGVFKGSGLLTWLKLISMYEPNSIKKVIGFDFFNPSFVDELDSDIDRTTMKQVFDRCSNLDKDDVSLEGIRNKIINAGFSESKFDLIQGDITLTSKKIVDERPGFRISVLYMDLDLDEPTYNTLVNLWDRVVPGGRIVFDEYGYHSWSESNAVDRFVKEHNLTLHSTFIQAPTAYIIK